MPLLVQTRLLLTCLGEQQEMAKSLGPYTYMVFRIHSPVIMFCSIISMRMESTYIHSRSLTLWDSRPAHFSPVDKHLCHRITIKSASRCSWPSSCVLCSEGLPKAMCPLPPTVPPRKISQNKSNKTNKKGLAFKIFKYFVLFAKKDFLLYESYSTSSLLNYVS